MKKFGAVILALTIAFTSLGAVKPITFPDVKGTKYESAVQNLVSMGVISGYTDGTFKPQNAISRAEMAMILIKTIDKTTYEDMKAVPFTDIASHWASEAIAFAYSLGIVDGMTATTFAPASGVTYAQAATMIVRALGHTDASLGGTWSTNYMTKAAALGLFDQIDEDGKASKPANRGDIALMTNAVAQVIRDEYKEEKPETTEPQDNGKLEDFSGRAIGVPLSIAAVMNEKRDAVDELEFLLGGETYYLNTKKMGDVTITNFKPEPAGIYTGNLYVARMTGGIVRKLEVATASNLGRYVELTADATSTGAFRLITDVKNQRVTVSGAAITDFGYADEAICYQAVFDGNVLDTFKSVRTSSIGTGDYIRAWDLDKDWAGIAIVTMLIDKDDVAAATAYSII